MKKRISKSRCQLPMPVESIQRRIYLIRSQKVMLDRDLAALYQVPTKVFNQAIRRNLDRFPEDFMFRLTGDEASALRSQIVTLEKGRGRHAKYAPYAFTEHGVAMLSSVLRSKRAVQINISIVRVFVRLRELIAGDKELAHRMNHVERTLKKHAQAITVVYDEVKRLQAPPEVPKRRIGFATASAER